MKQTLILAILDGWGIGNMDESNPIYVAKPQAMQRIHDRFPGGALQSSGIMVGLPWGEEGNSEVGHLTIGAGKILYQHFPRISLAVKDGSFYENKALRSAFAHAKKTMGAVHLIGLLTSGNVHASLEHLAALLEMAKREKCGKLFLHLSTDGRDGPPRSALDLIARLREEIERAGVGEIASIAGRYYAMDRDKHWDRTARAYAMLLGDAPHTNSPEEAVKSSYGKNIADEFIEPSVSPGGAPIRDRDAVIFFNFREDRMRQLVTPFVDANFKQFPVTPFKNLFIATMTQYDETFSAAVAFPNETVEHPLGKVLADEDKIQLRIAETEKYAHVTYFFNGLREKPYPNEYRILIPSEHSSKPEEFPEMRASAITDRALVALGEGRFDFILLNYANPDIIAHTGNYDATILAVKAVDREIDRLTKATLEGNHVLCITSDHGNAEVVLDPQTGEVETKHNPSPVPFYLVGSHFERKGKPDGNPFKLPSIGLLSDVAPTILELMKLPKPEEMTGQNLLPQLL